MTSNSVCNNQRAACVKPKLVQLYSSSGIALDAPFLQGHFPGNPIVPGAVLLGFSTKALLDLGYEITQIQRMKFKKPLLPCQPFEISFEKGGTISKLIWSSAGDVLADARVMLRKTDG